VKFARKTIEQWVRDRKPMQKPRNLPPEFYRERGVFVTLYTHPEKRLRGCIGIPQPVKPLIEALIDAAMGATQDPRFMDLTAGELDKTTVEVSVLTPPEKIRVHHFSEYPKAVDIGKDGLIIRNGMQSGLLLPQVPLEYGWDGKTFLEHLCLKAMLPKDAWTYEGTQIFRFHSEIFTEKSPGGKIEKVKS